MIGRTVSLCARHALAVTALFTVLVALAVGVTVKRLDVTTDTDKMFSSDLPWKRQAAQMAHLFPQNQDLLVAVIRADIPEEAEATARALTAALSTNHVDFRTVSDPDANPFLARNGLLYLDRKPLGQVLDDTVNAQAFLGTLAADPSARGLFDALSLVAQGVQAGQDLSGFAGPLNNFASALGNAAGGKADYLSWQRLLAGDLANLAGQYQFVLTQPRLDYGSFQPGGAATDAMRKAIASLEFVRNGHAQVFVTGDVEISDEEFATVAQGMVAGLAGSLVLVTLWLVLAVRSWRVIVPIVVVLVFGLTLTTGFAAIAVGTLNLISVAFAVLFVGIAVDFAIQFCVRFRAQHSDNGGSPHLTEALLHTGAETGHQILVAACATAAGFLAFTPTAFIGVAQLGLIAGIGMLIAFVCTITLLPALLLLMHPRLEYRFSGFAFAQPADRAVRRHRRFILGTFAALAVLGAALVPMLHFDADPLHTKDPHTEGMRAIHLLTRNPQTTPYSAELLVPSLDQARDYAKRFEALPSVDSVMWLGSYVPEDQPQKLAMIQDAASLLMPGLTVTQPAPAPDAAALRQSAKKAADAIASISSKLAANDPLRRIQSELSTLATQPDGSLLHVNDLLTRFLPQELDQLRTVLGAGPVTITDIPPDIARNYLLPDGRARLEIRPKNVLGADAAMYTFVGQIRSVAPDVGGTVVTVIESAHTMVHAFTVAALSALAMIGIILLLALRRVGDVLLVLAPLLLSALMTVILIIVVPEPLNFANIIALPLLLGVGVSFNVYFVMNWRSGVRRPLSSPTARAVLFSALTTGTAFGSLALSHHPGTASMGRLLLLSLGCTLLATLVFVPALLPEPPTKRD
ncbi:hypothetical protein AA103196_0743 [Ameyamaea chiangmaiensis NBRC 103196]|nr:hypothetical protein AA103196_0743 [Ameyamaea chiangmaiensis NBRC 103196]